MQRAARRIDLDNSGDILIISHSELSSRPIIGWCGWGKSCVVVPTSFFLFPEQYTVVCYPGSSSRRSDSAPLYRSRATRPPHPRPSATAPISRFDHSLPNIFSVRKKLTHIPSVFRFLGLASALQLGLAKLTVPSDNEPYVNSTLEDFLALQRLLIFHNFEIDRCP